MFSTLHPNRWILYAVAFPIVIFELLMWQIGLYAIEQRYAPYATDAQASDLIYQIHKNRHSNIIDTSSWETYQNEKYGFSLILGDGYKGYSVKEQEEKTGNLVASITFTVDAKGTHWYPDEKFNVFSIHIYPVDWWNKNADVASGSSGTSFIKGTDDIAGPEGYLGQYMGKNNKYAFAWGHGQDCPSLNNSDNSIWCDLYKNINKTTATAKFFEPKAN